MCRLLQHLLRRPNFLNAINIFELSSLQNFSNSMAVPKSINFCIGHPVVYINIIIKDTCLSVLNVYLYIRNGIRVYTSISSILELSFFLL